ncbi:MAG: hypothetical protein II438_07010, partial [Clostridiales bacterium]|nr:hypothetical protein [Clostridiales bacterium]
ATGDAGLAGSTGLAGATGAAGLAGSTGLAGATGAAGLAGSTGLAGATGAAGFAGSTGLAGAGAGAAGAFWATDLKGLMGACVEGLKSSSRNSANAFSAFIVACVGVVKRFVIDAEGWGLYPAG